MHNTAPPPPPHTHSHLPFPIKDFLAGLACVDGTIVGQGPLRVIHPPRPRLGHPHLRVIQVTQADESRPGGGSAVASEGMAGGEGASAEGAGQVRAWQGQRRPGQTGGRKLGGTGREAGRGGSNLG